MPRIADADIDRVKRETDLLALVRSRGIELQKHGSKDWKGLCPFHGDQGTPNLIVSPDKGLWHCMACGKAGNPIQFVQHHDGISFRHAFEVLADGSKAAYLARPQTSQRTVPVLPCPLDPEADDATLLQQVTDYYQERLKAVPTARAYLASRGLDSDDLISRHRLGFADRTLGLRLPEANRKTGELLRTRLTQLGVWRESGHEHFNGCIVVPLFNAAGKIVSYYGRRIGPGTVKHLYSPGPHRACSTRQRSTRRKSSSAKRSSMRSPFARTASPTSRACTAPRAGRMNLPPPSGKRDGCGWLMTPTTPEIERQNGTRNGYRLWASTCSASSSVWHRCQRVRPQSHPRRQVPIVAHQCGGVVRSGNRATRREKAGARRGTKS